MGLETEEGLCHKTTSIKLIFNWNIIVQYGSEKQMLSWEYRYDKTLSYVLSMTENRGRKTVPADGCIRFFFLVKNITHLNQYKAHRGKSF